MLRLQLSQVFCGGSVTWLQLQGRREMPDGLLIITLAFHEQAERCVGMVLPRVELQGCVQVLQRRILFALLLEEFCQSDMHEIISRI